MFQIEKVTKDTRQMVRAAFYQDKDLVDKFHINAGQGIEKCVDEEMEVFIKRTTPRFELYRILYGGTFFGFIGTDKTSDGEDFLTTFHLRKCYRSKSLVKEFWSTIRMLFKGGPFFTALYDKNSRAVNFLIRNNAEILGSYRYKNVNVLEFKIN